MAQMNLPGHDAAGAVLTALDPILNAQDSAVVTRVVAGIRAAEAPPTVLGATLYVFSKLVVSNERATRLFRDVVNSLVSSGALPRDVLYEAIDTDTHQLIEPGVDHVQEERRARTRLWFTQTRFNLFREESEGYAKLIALLWECVSSYDEIEADVLIDALLALIGQFNLDSNRVIELVLSAAADVVNEQITNAKTMPKDHRLPSLFARLLDEFARDHVFSVLGAMLQSYHAVPAMAGKATTNGSSSKHATLGSGEAAVDSTVTEPETRTPTGIFMLIAVLIREGRVAVADIWHHLSPRDNSEIATHSLNYEKNLEELKKYVTSSSFSRPSNGQDLGIFQRSGIGASERDIFQQYKFVTAGPFTGFNYQKLDFLLVLINLGRLDDAMDAILSLDVDGEHIDIACHPIICSTLATFVELLMNPVLCSQFPNLYAKNTIVTEAIAGLGGRKNRYPCSILSVDDLLSTAKESSGILVREILTVLGAHSRRSPTLLHALCRLLKGRNEPEAITIMKEVILPAFSLLQSNLGLGDAIWDVIRDWSHNDRWQLYGHLQNEVATTCAVYGVVASRAAYEMKYILKRLTTENYKQHMKTITKITHGQALPAFSAALDRIQGYPPDAVTVSPVVDACRECTELSVDILLYLIIDRMADSRRRRLKEDGINIAQWYSTLCLFLGLCLRKLPVNSQQIEGVLSFLYTKLVIDREALLITALSDVIKCVADIEIESNLTAKQVSAQGGGRHLRSSVSGIWGRMQPDARMVGIAFDNKLEREKRGAMLALLGAFERTEMHVQIAIQIAQLSREAIYQEDLRVMPLKLGANIIDRAKSSLLQLSQFMDTVVPNTTKDGEIRAGVWEPLRTVGVSRLINEMGVSTSSAVSFLSPILDYLGDGDNITALEEAHLDRRSTEKADNSKSPLTSEAHDGMQSGEKLNDKVHGVIEMKDGDGDIQMSSTGTKDSQGSGYETANGGPNVVNRNWSRSVLAFAETISKRTKGFISPEFARAFWTLKLDDIAVPVELYSSEIKRLNAIRGVWENEVDRYRRHTHGESDRRRRGEAELRRVREFIDSLSKEKDAFEKRQFAILQRLRVSGKELWSPLTKEDGSAAEKAVDFFIQECVFPRCKVSISDALFCARFVFLLLEFDAPVLDYSYYFECLLKLIPIALSSSTENEALCIARLVKEVLTCLEKWRSNRKIFESEASKSKTHGFRQPETSGSNPLRHEQYCQWLFDIHERLTEGLCLILASEEYLYSRNSLCVLAGIADVFPKVSEHSQKIEDHVHKLCSSDLPDIRLSSTGVLARLKSGKAKRLPRHVFMLKPSSGGSSNTAVAGAKRPRESKNVKTEPSEPPPPPSGNAKIPPHPVSKGNTMQEPSVANSGGSQNNPIVVSAQGVDVGKKNLNPNAKEFTPTTKDIPKTAGYAAAEKKSGAVTATGKRSRETMTDAHARVATESSRFDRGPKDPSAQQAPPLKRSRNAENRTGADGRKPPENRTGADHGRKPPGSERNYVATTREASSGSKLSGTVHNLPKNHDRHATEGGDKPNHALERKSGAVLDDRDKVTQSDTVRRESQGLDNNVREDPKDSKGHQATRVSAVPSAKAGDQTAKALSRPEASSSDALSRNAPVPDVHSRQKSEPTVLVRRNSGRDINVKVEDKRELMNQGPSSRDVGSRDGNVRGSGIRPISARDGSSRNADGRDASAEDAKVRDAPSRGTIAGETPRESGRDSYHRNASRRTGVKRESPGNSNMQRYGPGRETPSRDVNGIAAKDSGRRKRSDEPTGGYQYGMPTDPGIPGHTSEYDEPYGDGGGVKRGREYPSQRTTYTYDGDARRSNRQRTDDPRERSASREDVGKNAHDRRFNGPKTSPRENRFEGGFPPQVPTPGAQMWNDSGRPRTGVDASHDGRGNGSGHGPRRRDNEFEHNPGWKPRPPERPMDFGGGARDRQSARPRDDVRREGDYGYDDRGGNRGFRDRRNSGRDDRGPRDRYFPRQRNHARNGSRRK